MWVRTVSFQLPLPPIFFSNINFSNLAELSRLRKHKCVISRIKCILPQPPLDLKNGGLRIGGYEPDLNINLGQSAQGVLAIFIYGGVGMKGQIQTQKYGFTVNFAPKNIVILHIVYPKLWVAILF